MKALAICHHGFEEVAASELSEISGCKTEVVPGGIIINVPDENTIADLTYRSQSIRRIMLLLNEFEFNDKYLEKVKETEYPYLKERTFRVNCHHHENELHSMEVARETGEAILETNETKVDINEPDTIVMIYVYENIAYLGIDFAGIDLSKRDYKIYNHPASLNGSFAYNLIRYSGWTPEKIMLDPLCGSGIIPIEAALKASGTSPHHYTKDNLAFTRLLKYNFPAPKKKDAKILCSDHMLACIRATKNNAKIAGVDSLIKPAKHDLDWLETKHDEEEIDHIITHPPSVSKHTNPREMAKHFNEVFYQAEYILKQDGTVAVLALKPELIIEAAEKNQFKLAERIIAHQGKQPHHVLLFKKAADKTGKIKEVQDN